MHLKTLLQLLRYRALTFDLSPHQKKNFFANIWQATCYLKINKHHLLQMLYLPDAKI